MSVDTQPQRKKSIKGYQVVRQNGVDILVSYNLAQVARSIHVGLKRFLFLRSFSIEVEPKDDHIHGPA